MRDHAHTLSDFSHPHPLDRVRAIRPTRRYAIANLMLPELLYVLADCPKARGWWRTSVA